MLKKTYQCNFMLAPELYEVLLHEAARRRVSISTLVRRALYAHLLGQKHLSEYDRDIVKEARDSDART